MDTQQKTELDHDARIEFDAMIQQLRSAHPSAGIAAILATVRRIAQDGNGWA